MVSVVGSNFSVSMTLTVSCRVAPEALAASLADLVAVAAVQATTNGRRATTDTGHTRFTGLPIPPGNGTPVGKQPKVTTLLGFDGIDTLSARHQWFTSVRLLGSYLTHC